MRGARAVASALHAPILRLDLVTVVAGAPRAHGLELVGANYGCSVPKPAPCHCTDAGMPLSSCMPGMFSRIPQMRAIRACSAGTPQR